MEMIRRRDILIDGSLPRDHLTEDVLLLKSAKVFYSNNSEPASIS
jgi:hypothetical protein